MLQLGATEKEEEEEEEEEEEISEEGQIIGGCNTHVRGKN
jgi:hypothetical protein